MGEVRVLIAAAGKGTRAGLPFPKALYPVGGRPILVRLCEAVQSLDRRPTVVVSPAGREPVEQCLMEYGRDAELIVQSEPRGMGDAVLRFEESSAFATADNVLLAWGDIPFLQAPTIDAVVEAHFRKGNDLTLATRQVDAAYTVVSRDHEGNVLGVAETRESGATATRAGERDIGLFVFRKAPVFALLKEDLPGRLGQTTGEHGFLYVIEHLVRRGYRVDAIPVATELDLVSLNSLSDVKAFS